jgi:hypothetical protein
VQKNGASRTFNFTPAPPPHPHLVNKSRYSMHPRLRGPGVGLDVRKKHKISVLEEIGLHFPDVRTILTGLEISNYFPNVLQINNFNYVYITTATMKHTINIPSLHWNIPSKTIRKSRNLLRYPYNELIGTKLFSSVLHRNMDFKIWKNCSFVFTCSKIGLAP